MRRTKLGFSQFSSFSRDLSLFNILLKLGASTRMRGGSEAMRSQSHASDSSTTKKARGPREDRIIPTRHHLPHNYRR